MPEPAPSSSRLVIRIKLPPKGLPPVPARQPLNRGALLLVLGIVAVLLTWLGIELFSAPDSVPQRPAPVAAPTPAPTQSTPAVSEVSPATPAPEPPVATPAPNSPINEVIPNVPRSARETIQGTIRVVIRVIVAKDGTVLAATPETPGPSRYFARLALEASKKWTFAPTDSDEQRVMLVRFNFTRGGTTGRASSLQ